MNDTIYLKAFFVSSYSASLVLFYQHQYVFRNLHNIISKCIETGKAPMRKENIFSRMLEKEGQDDQEEIEKHPCNQFQLFQRLI